MPVCRYEIREETANGDLVSYAQIGQPVYHKWTCDAETGALPTCPITNRIHGNENPTWLFCDSLADIFCMRVHSCYVEDSRGERRAQLINFEGCTNDIYLLNTPTYLTDLMYGVEAHVFKYADRTQVYFQCQIGITVKVMFCSFAYRTYFREVYGLWSLPFTDLWFQDEGEACPQPSCPKITSPTELEPSPLPNSFRLSLLEIERARQRDEPTSFDNEPEHLIVFRRKRRVEETIDVCTQLNSFDMDIKVCWRFLDKNEQSCFYF